MTTRPFRPSNGTHGAIFMEHFCDRCKRDEAYRNGTGDSCPIVANSFVYAADDPKYPKEWVEDEGADPGMIGAPGARCTAFEPMEAA